MRTTYSTPRRSATRQRRMACLRGKLLEKRQLLVERMKAELLEPAEPIGVPGDPADIAHSISARETSYEIELVESDAVVQIDRVLSKMDSGNYGICENCGKRIPDARLRIVPFTCLCVECKERDEQEAQARRMEAAFRSSDLQWLDETDTADPESRHATMRGKRVA